MSVFGIPIFPEQASSFASDVDALYFFIVAVSAFFALLIAISVTFVLAGIFLAYLVYSRHRLKAVEPELLEHGWYVDEGVAALVGGPGEASWEGIAQFDHKVVDGTVMGAGAVITDTGRGLRRFQTGLIRVYAVGIGIGAVLLLGWFLLAGVL